MAAYHLEDGPGPMTLCRGNRRRHDRPVDVALGGEVNDDVVVFDKPLDQVGVSHIAEDGPGRSNRSSWSAVALTPGRSGRRGW